jgi:hypothetical protein
VCPVSVGRRDCFAPPTPALPSPPPPPHPYPLHVCGGHLQGISTGSFVRYRVAVEAVWNHKPFPSVVPAGTTQEVCPTSTAVLRRYSDFDWLYHRLVATAPNCFVPLLPPKVCVHAPLQCMLGGRPFAPMCPSPCMSHGLLVRLCLCGGR